MTPALDVAEPYEALAMKRHYAFSPRYLLRDILGSALGYARAPLHGRFVDQPYDEVGIDSVLGFGKLDRDVFSR